MTREGLEPSLFDGNQRLALRSSNFGHLPRRQYQDVTRVIDARRSRCCKAERANRGYGWSVCFGAARGDDTYAGPPLGRPISERTPARQSHLESALDATHPVLGRAGQVPQ